MKYAAFDINFDSLGETYNFPADFSDPTFSFVAERFLSLARKYGFKYSIYVIGKDLLRDENRRAVKAWADEGHEIGNHSWSHPLCLGAMSEADIRAEITQAHKLIAETTGTKPRGFIAPGWSNSRKLLRTLAELGYEYDTSCFPSVLLYPGLLMLLAKHLKDGRFFSILRRKDYLAPFFGSRLAEVHDFAQDRIVSLPLPTNQFRLACWHTLVFYQGWELHRAHLRSCLKEIDAFYYVLHPADLLTLAEVPNQRGSTRVARLGYSIEDKMRLLESSIEEILRGRQIVTMRELARLVSDGKIRPQKKY